jgi:hypothetical protein
MLMVNSLKPQGYRRKEDMATESTVQALQEQALIDSIAETLESSTAPIVLEERNVRERSFFATAASCVPYVIMAMGVYMIWTRTRALFKSANDDRKEAQG